MGAGGRVHKAPGGAEVSGGLVGHGERDGPGRHPKSRVSWILEKSRSKLREQHLEIFHRYPRFVGVWFSGLVYLACMGRKPMVGAKQPPLTFRGGTPKTEMAGWGFKRD